VVQGFYVQKSVLLLSKLIILGWLYNVVVGVSHHMYTYMNIYSLCPKLAVLTLNDLTINEANHLSSQFER
jgi:hypothetical protein